MFQVDEKTIQRFDPARFFNLPKDYFNRTGDLKYINSSEIELIRGGWKYFTPYKGWIRYGLNVEKFGVTPNSGGRLDSKDWLGHTGHGEGEWAVAFHGLRRNVSESFRGIANHGFQIFTGKNSQWGSTFKDVGHNKHLFSNKTCGIGVFCSPKLAHLTANTEGAYLVKPIKLKYDSNVYIECVFQCRVRPHSIRVPECADGQYYIINRSEDIRPYGLLVRFITNTEANEILSANNFQLNPISKAD
jgi:hypothetical protein